MELKASSMESIFTALSKPARFYEQERFVAVLEIPRLNHLADAKKKKK
jgi:hypothetical protein